MSDIEATKAELCDDVRRATEYCTETSRFALEWLRRAEAAERERDALKLGVRQLQEFIGRREDDILSIARERDALKAEVERLRSNLRLAANRLDRLALEDTQLKANADDWAQSARSALMEEEAET
ncbi:hypothetical protein [Xanthobacter sediminis]|uniref:hypothetical protein n=1 Tax=Xanthobacter sediminis TaxID=3119926 RepID=UPI00372C42C0